MTSPSPVCSKCDRPHGGDNSTCDKCLAIKRRSDRKARAAHLKAAGGTTCHKLGCKRPRVHASAHCLEHKLYYHQVWLKRKALRDRQREARYASGGTR